MSKASPAPSIFFAALERTSAVARAAFLDEVCGPDEGLRRQIERLLAAHEQAGDFLQRPVAEAANLAAYAPPDPPASSPDTHGGDTPGGRPPPDDPLAFLAASQQPNSLGRLGHYEVLEVVGKGAMGIVLRARDEKLNRIVAIKVLAPQLATSASARQRFIREGRSAAAVTHDNVIDVHAVEDSGPIPYLVMQFIDGPTLQGKLEQRGPLPVREVLRIGQQIAAGLAAAHAQGLVHRDVKPANILLENGVERVKITDFGLARAVDDASLTQSGIIAGTPAYASPEQAEGIKVDHRSDLFSLGSVLYTLCAGHAPFRADTTMAVLRRVCEQTPQPLHETNPDIPDWLEAIIARLHAKNPAKRLQSAAEVADLLGQHLAALQGGDGSNVPGKRARRKRAPRAVRMVVIALTVLLAGSSAAYWLWSQSQEETGSDAGNGAAPAVPAWSQRVRALLPSPLDRLKRETMGLPEDAPPELLAVLGESARFPFPGPGHTHWMAQTSDRRLLAVPRHGTILLFETQTGRLLQTLTGIPSQYRPVFSPDGKRLASGSGDGHVRIWDVESGREELILADHQAGVLSVAFDPAGEHLASSDEKGVIRVWDAQGKLQARFAGHARDVNHLLFSPDGKRLATASNDGTCKIWDAVTWKEIRSLSPKGKVFLQVAWSRDGRLLAAGDQDQVLLWNADTYEMVHTLSTSGSGLVAFIPDGRTLLTARMDYTPDQSHAFTRWDVNTGMPGSTWTLPTSGSSCFYQLSPDGQTVFVARPAACRVEVYDAQTGTDRNPLRGHAGAIQSVAFSPDGRLLATGSYDQTIRLWDLESWKTGEPRPPSRVLSGPADTVWTVVFSPDGSLLATSGCTDGMLRLWDTASGRVLHKLSGHSRNWPLVAFSPVEALVAAGGENGTVNQWEVRSGRPLPPLGNNQGPIRGVAFSPDGRLLAAGGERAVQVIDRKTGQCLHTFPGETLCGNLAFTADSKTLVGTNEAPGPRLRVWDIETGKEQPPRTGHTNHILGLALQPGGRLAATGSWDGTVRLWDLADAVKEARVFDFHDQVNQVAFSPDGHYLAVARADHMIAILRIGKTP
jgi:WD40 repeat protein/serine/threonine protein kinase